MVGPNRVGIRVAAAGVILFLPGIFLMDFWVVNEGRRAIIALELLNRGDWICPRLMGVPILTKPPLFYWLEALSFSLSGQAADWAARLPSVFAGVLGLLALVRLLGLLFGSEAALFGGLVLAVTPIYNWMAQMAEPEMVFVASSLAALALFVEGLASPAPPKAVGPQKAWVWTAWGLLGCSFLAKGPLAPAATLLTVLAWMKLRRRPIPLRNLGFGLGLPLMLAPTLAWLIGLELAGHPISEIWGEMALHLDEDAPHEGPPTYYFENLRTLAFPWAYALVLILAGSLWAAWARGGRSIRGALRRIRIGLRRRSGAGLLLLAWFLAALVPISLVTSKRYYYGLVLAPPVAGLIAWAYHFWIVRGRGLSQAPRVDCPRPAALSPRLGIALKIAVAAGLALAVAGLLLPRPEFWEAFNGEDRLDKNSLCLVFGVWLAGAAAGLAIPRVRALGLRLQAWWILALMFLTALVYEAALHPRNNARLSLKQAAKELAATLPPGQELFAIDDNYTVCFYLGRPDIPVLFDEQQVREYLQRRPAAWGIAFEKNLDLLEKAGPLRIIYRSAHIAKEKYQVLLVGRKPPTTSNLETHH